MNRPKILFIYDMPKDHDWCDGLWAALNLLENDFEITRHNIKDTPDGKYYDEDGSGIAKADYDFILGWGGFGSPVDKIMQQLDYAKKGLCIGGNAYGPAGANNYDVLFYETKWYRSQIDFHPNIFHAFGVNTDIFFVPDDYPFPILWEYIGVGAFASWKRWNEMIKKEGQKIVVGYYQNDNEEESGGIVKELIKNGVTVSNQINPYDLSMLYHCCRKAFVPASIIGGGERSVLEARACGLAVEVMDDNPKLKELLESPIYDHHYYAKQLKEGVLSVI